MPGRFIAFVRRDALEQAGMNPDRIYSTNDLWGSDLPKSAYQVFLYDAADPESKEYKRLEKDPNYLKLTLGMGN